MSLWETGANNKNRKQSTGRSVPYAGALFTSLVVSSCLTQRHRSVPYGGALFTSLVVSPCLPQRHVWN